MRRSRGSPVSSPRTDSRERAVRAVGAALLATAAEPAQFPPPERPEFAFAGRSNVGKSSLLNRLAGRRGLARTSAEPGKTRLINFFSVSSRVEVPGAEPERREVVLVDLPGYGYARVSKEERNRWRGRIEAYLVERPVLRAVFVLQDVRREIGEAERDLFAWLVERGIPAVLVVTKIDKLAPMQRARRVRELTQASGLERDCVVACSAVTGDGVDALWRAILDAA